MSQFNQAEIKMLITMLNTLSDQQGNSGCNDLYLPKTNENIEFMEFYNKYSNKDDQLRLGTKYITGNDINLTYYFINKLTCMVNE